MGCFVLLCLLRPREADIFSGDFFVFADFGDALFLLADVDLPRSCCGDFVAAARLRLLSAGTADFLGLEAAAFDFDFAGDFSAGEDLAAGDDLAAAAGERTLPRVTRFSVDDGVFEAERLALRGILTIFIIS